jgi:hypothetical protein
VKKNADESGRAKKDSWKESNSRDVSYILESLVQNITRDVERQVEARDQRNNFLFFKLSSLHLEP